MFRIAAVFGLLLPWVFASTVLAQPAPQVTITAPSDGATAPGPDVTVTIQVSGTTLVPAANATKLQDMHVHYMLDVDPAPYLSGTTPVPAGNPNIVHAGALSNTFTGVAPGQHKVTVLLGFSDHRAVQPPVAPSVSFTVAGAGAAPAAAAPGQLPRTGDASPSMTSAPLLMAGSVLAVLGVALLGFARSGLGHRR